MRQSLLPLFSFRGSRNTYPVSQSIQHVIRINVLLSIVGAVIDDPSAYNRLQNVCVVVLIRLNIKQVLVENDYVGKFADIIVLDQNLFDIESNQNYDTNVLQTIVGGRVVYDRTNDGKQDVDSDDMLDRLANWICVT